MTVVDKDGPYSSCGRKECQLPTSIVGWQLRVEMLPQILEQCFTGWKFSAVGMKLVKKGISLGHLPTTHVISSAVCVLHRHGEQACNH